MLQVVDSNYLQSERLRAYLAQGAHNFAVLPDYTAMEAYKGDTLSSIFKSMSILSRYPKQVIVLKGTQEVCGLTETGARMRKRMVDRDQTRGFPAYCRHLRTAELGDADLQSQILRIGKDASDHFDTLFENAQNMSVSMQQLATNFTQAEVRLIRGGNSYSAEIIDKIVKQAMLVAAHMFVAHPRVKQRTSARALPDRFIFRFALCSVLWVLDWIASGSPTSRRPEKTRNDLADLQIITYATYFDGLLTADRKAIRLHAELGYFLRLGFGVSSHVGTENG